MKVLFSGSMSGMVLPLWLAFVVYTQASGAQHILECAVGCDSEPPAASTSSINVAGVGPAGVAPEAVATAMAGLRAAGVEVMHV